MGANDTEKDSFDPNLPELKTLAIMSYEDQRDIMIKELKEYSDDTRSKADSALTMLNTQLNALQHKIEAVKPDILGKKWDFVLKGDKIEVTGSLKSDEKQWLENNLNRNPLVLNAVKDVYSSVIKAYEHTEDHPSTIAYENGDNKFAYGVAEQIDGKLQLRSLMDQATEKKLKSYWDN